MKRLFTSCIEKNEKEKRTRIWKICCVVSFSTILLFSMAAWGDAVKVDVYTGCQMSGGGTPYSGYIGTLYASDVMFATGPGHNWDWHPFSLSGFGADITGSLEVAADNAYDFTLNSDDGSMLYIDGGLVVNNGGVHGPTTHMGTVVLSAGIHPFEVQFFEDGNLWSGVDLSLPAGVSYVPEPATICLLSLGVLGLLRKRRK
jgi:hypothetical protein